MSNPTVSIVTVCKNAESTIAATIRSVVEQTVTPIEYVVIDGASTDSTLQIVHRYRNRIAHVVSEPDSGLYHAMNKALRLVTGEIILFLNADDTLYSNSVIQLVVEEFARHPEAMLVYGNCVEVGGGQELLRPAPPVLTAWRLWLNALCHQAMFVRRNAYEKVGFFDESLRVCADWEWTARAVLVHQIPAVYLPQEICRFALGGVCSNRDVLEHDIQVLRRRHFSRPQRIVFSAAEFLLKVGVRLRRRDFTLPWQVRRVMGMEP
jgi:glycosyltransferase involved in cell wall biosynthesis